MGIQLFDTADVLTLEIENPATSYNVNRLPNPDGEHGLLGWFSAQQNVSLSPSPSWGGIGVSAMTSGTVTYQSIPVLVEPGRPFVRFAHIASLALTGHRIRFLWHDGDGAAVWASAVTTFGSGVSGTTCGTSVTAVPDYASMVSVMVELANSSTGAYPVGTPTGNESIIFRSACLWFGSSAESAAMGTAAPASTPQPTWTNVLPAARQVEITRAALDVGTLTTAISDRDLTPTGSDPLLRSGRRIRCTATTNGQRLFTGTITGVKTDWNLLELTRKPDSDDAAVVTVTAQDASAALVATQRATGPARIYGVPAVLNGTGVPWNAAGNMGTRNDWLTNGQAGSALDMLVVARDSERAAIWVDRNGWVQAWHHNQMAESTCPYEPGEFTARRSVDGWSGFSNMASMTYSQSGGYAQITSGAVGSGLCEAIGYTTFDAMPVVPSATIGISIEAAAPSVARTPRVGIRYYDVSGNVISTVGADLASIPAGTTSYSIRSVTSTAPAGAFYAALIVGFYPVAGTNGTVLRVRRVTGHVTAPIAATRMSLFGESEYADAPIGSDPGINVVSVDTRVFATTTTHGPFTDVASVAAHGRRRGRFTVAPLGDGGAIWASRFARGVFTRAAAGRDVQPQALRVPVTTTALVDKATIDLYDAAGVIGTDSWTFHRVMGIRHTITPKDWQLHLDLTSLAAVAPPTTT